MLAPLGTFLVPFPGGFDVRAVSDLHRFTDMEYPVAKATYLFVLRIASHRIRTCEQGAIGRSTFL